MSIPSINSTTTTDVKDSQIIPTTSDITRVREFLVDLQARICQALEAQERDGGGDATFVPDDWERPEGGARAS